MNNIQRALQILANCGDRDWKVGKTDSYIKSVSSKIDALPSSVFDKFFIGTDSSRKISTVDFVLMTYDMSSADKKSLMDMYDIDQETVTSILTAADEIVELMGSAPEVAEDGEDATPYAIKMTDISKADDEVEI